VETFFDSQSGAELATLFTISLASSIVWMRVFPRLRTPATRGIVKLQLARTTSRANAIVRAWREQHLLGRAKRSLIVDFPYIASYSFAIAFLALLAGRAAATSGLMSSDTANVSADATAIAAWSAGFCDLLENAGLVLLLRGVTGQPAPAITSFFAGIKWFFAPAAALFSLGLLSVSALKALGWWW
jgi:hypothetical protein